MGYASYGTIAFLSAIISAKWAHELGFTQFRQFLWFLVGFVIGPFGPLILYIRLVRKSVGIQD
jgi:hypothetical protein